MRAWHRLGRELRRGLKPGIALAWVFGMAVGGCVIEAGGRRLTAMTGDAGFLKATLLEGVMLACGVMPMAMASSAWMVRGMERAMGQGMTSGRALGWNLLGATLAPVLFGVFAIPLLGERGAWQVLLVMALGCAWVLTLKGRGLSHGGFARLSVAVALGGLGLVPRFDPTVMPPGVARLRRVVGVADTVEVWRWPDRSRTLTVNSRMTMGGTGTAAAAARQAHVPLMLHASAGKALFLGVGTGITLASARVYPGLQAVGVELVPEVVQVLGDFAPENALGPLGQVVTADARRYLRTPGPKFDVIIGDLFHPERDGAALLYTEEHFRAMRDRLEPDGVACQWLPWFQLDDRSRALVVSAWLKVFPDSDAWLLRWTTLDTPVIGLVHGGDRPGPVEWTRRVGRGGLLRDALRRAGFADPWQFWGCWIGPLSTFPGTAPGANTDDRPAVLWSAARGASEARKDARSSLLSWLNGASGQMPPWSAQGKAEGERWDKMRRARDLYLAGLDALMDGRVEDAQRAMWLSVGQSKDFPSSYGYLVERAMSYEKRMPELGRAMLERLGRERPEVPVGKELLDRLEARQGRKAGEGGLNPPGLGR